MITSWAINFTVITRWAIDITDITQREERHARHWQTSLLAMNARGKSPSSLALRLSTSPGALIRTHNERFAIILPSFSRSLGALWEPLPTVYSSEDTLSLLSSFGFTYPRSARASSADKQAWNWCVWDLTEGTNEIVFTSSNASPFKISAAKNSRYAGVCQPLVLLPD